METNKLLGYTTIEVSDGVLPLKIGMYTLQYFCESYGVSLDKIDEVFDYKKVPQENSDKDLYIPVPKEPIKFLAHILHHGVNYLRDGQPLFPLMRAYEWIEEIGFGSPKATQISVAFTISVKNGGKLVDIDALAPSQSKNPTKKKNPSPSKTLNTSQ